MKEWEGSHERILSKQGHKFTIRPNLIRKNIYAKGYESDGPLPA